MSTKFNFNTEPRRNGSKKSARAHALPNCAGTGLMRFRDRHQARDGAKAVTARAPGHEVSTFACPDCRGWHIETRRVTAASTEVAAPLSAPTNAFRESLPTRKRRYFLIDIENPTRGAKAKRQEVAKFWDILKRQAPGIAPLDHVVVGASRSVVNRYRTSITGANVKWVTGDNTPDGADRALLGAIDLYRVARHFDELVIVSGDHAFADLARRAKSFGLSVQVVTAENPGGRPMLSHELAGAADVHTTVRLKARPNRNENLRRLNLLKASLRGAASDVAVAA
jgi:hypothetical protein